ncbi:hypothetical protein KFE25_013588 [Diacronema lutheri]|uniref:CHCH domain-containing protein n=1 Tax=Diacronema lutheri TaxID=2081491 RepID=A0A8J5XZM7_DIALT|nr:hypothetical protein KFE25_013588 [Diacronema lutheri]
MAQPAKAAPGRAPDKGSFPLDHLAECKAAMDEYMRCMRENGMETYRCREQSAAYLTCRMERNLMASEDLANLGFRKAQQAPAPSGGTAVAPAQTDAARGFVAGLGRVHATREQAQHGR